MEIDRRAPALARSEIEIAADAETVWEVLTNLEQWPSWNPDVHSVVVEGEIAEGTRFKWKAGGVTIESTLREIDRPREIAWTGKTLGTAAIHVWRLAPRDGATLATTEESFNGWLPRLLRRRMQRVLADGLDSGLRHLKAEAERRAAD